MSTSDGFEHLDKFCYEYKKFDDIDALLNEYNCDSRHWNEDNRICFDIYVWTLKLLRANLCVRPITVYVALLENGYKANESRSLRDDCILTLRMLKQQRLLTWEIKDDEVITEYTIFMPVKGDRFNYFTSRIFEMSMNHMISSYGDVQFPAEDIV